MCGIFGFNFEDSILLRKMDTVLKHRGPDGNGYYSDRNISLGHRRLAVIDLSEKGKQPMSNEDESIWLIFNGEIYNYKALREKLLKKCHVIKSNTDSEVIIHLYEEYSKKSLYRDDNIKKFLNELDGMFALAIWDSKRNELLLARDPLGKKPLYYYYKNNKILFASELKAILEDPSIERKIDPISLRKFFIFRYIPNPDTILKDIKKIKPGNYVIYNTESNKISYGCYWQFIKNIEKNSETYFCSKLRELMEDSVKKRLVSDVPLGVYLSGGLDSSIITGLMSKYEQEIKTFSIGFEQESYSEVKYSRIVSEYFNTDHTEITIGSENCNILPKIIYHMDEPLADPAAIPTYILSEKAKKKVTVVLVGEGADEVFGGYEHYKFLNAAHAIRNVPKIVKNLMIPVIRKTPNWLLDYFFKYSSQLGEKGLSRVSDFLKINNPHNQYLSLVSIFSEAETSELMNRSDAENLNIMNSITTIKDNYNNYSLNDILSFEINNSLCENMLMKVDKTTMASAIEARAPFLDKSLVEFSAKMPVNLKLNGFKDKYILRKTFSNLLPTVIIKRKKQRFFVPINEWFGGEFESLCWDYANKGIKRGHFKREYIKKIENNYKKSPLYYSRQLWSVLTFEMWCEVFNIY